MASVGWTVDSGQPTNGVEVRFVQVVLFLHESAALLLAHGVAAKIETPARLHPCYPIPASVRVTAATAPAVPSLALSFICHPHFSQLPALAVSSQLGHLRPRCSCCAHLPTIESVLIGNCVSSVLNTVRARVRPAGGKRGRPITATDCKLSASSEGNSSQLRLGHC